MFAKLARVSLSTKSHKTIADVRAAFETRSILDASRRELEELLAAAACEKSDDPAERAQLREMGDSIRQLVENRRNDELRRPSRLAVLALLVMAAALLWFGVEVHQSRIAFAAAAREPIAVAQHTAEHQSELSLDLPDLRTALTIPELARRAPSLRNGTVQAWWAGEQARQVQRLEAQAKRQALAGDHAGAARTASRADAIRSRIPALAEFERPPTR